MKKINLIVLAIIGLFATGFAANPVTMTSFHNVFNYLEEVNQVSEHGMIDGRVISFLVDENTPIDQKAAVINVLVDNNKTKSNALTFKQYVARKYSENWENLDINKLNADELFCLGYMTILDAGGNSAEGTAILEKAAQKNPTSLTINLFHALAVAQSSIKSGNACEGWRATNSIKTNTSLNNDLDKGISNKIYDTMESFNKGC